VFAVKKCFSRCRKGCQKAIPQRVVHARVNSEKLEHDHRIVFTPGSRNSGQNQSRKRGLDEGGINNVWGPQEFTETLKRARGGGGHRNNGGKASGSTGKN